MWRCPQKSDVIDLYKRSNMPLDEDFVRNLNAIDDELKAQGINCGWVVIDAKCRICNYKQICLTPDVADLDNLECGNCACMSMQEREALEWET